MPVESQSTVPLPSPILEPCDRNSTEGLRLRGTLQGLALPNINTYAPYHTGIVPHTIVTESLSRF